MPLHIRKGIIQNLSLMKLALLGATCRALRVLAAQLRLLKLDSANWQLRQLARGLADGAGIRWAPGPFPNSGKRVSGMVNDSQSC